MNEFEAGLRKLIPAVLVYAESDGKILMLHRGNSGDGFHQGKWNGLGGKMEADESPFAAAVREFKEESGLAIASERFAHRGTLQFPNFKPHKNEDWIVFVFILALSKEEAHGVKPHCDEGKLEWISTSDILKLALWPGDLLFLQHVLAGETFSGTIWYAGGDVARHEIRVS